jgi:hypothetical protein
MLINNRETNPYRAKVARKACFAHFMQLRTSGWEQRVHYWALCALNREFAFSK